MENLKLFFLSCLVVNLIPGIDRILVLTISLKSGSRSGMFASMGISIATFIHALIVSCGLYLILKGNHNFFELTQQFGLGFLSLIGIYFIFRSLRGNTNRSVKNSSQNDFWKGFMIHFLNPLALIFIVSFMPQFIEEDTNFIVGFMLLSMISNCFGLLMNLATALFFGSLKKFMDRNQYLFRIVDFVAGLTLLSLVVLKMQDINF
jgi:threonine/homoserine/homoserine lactone efflux protein